MWRVKGLTLLELLIALAIVAILASLAVPFSQDLLVRNRVSTDVQSLIRRLQYARLAAIKSGQSITFCGSSDKQHCDGNWRAGQIAYREGNDTVVKHFSSMAEEASLQWRGFRSRDFIIFEPNGIAKTSAGHFAYQYKNYQRKITLNRVGRLRVS